MQHAQQRAWQATIAARMPQVCSIILSYPCGHEVSGPRKWGPSGYNQPGARPDPPQALAQCFGLRGCSNPCRLCMRSPWHLSRTCRPPTTTNLLAYVYPDVASTLLDNGLFPLLRPRRSQRRQRLLQRQLNQQEPKPSRHAKTIGAHCSQRW